MRTYRVKHVDAFTTHVFAGNPAGVVVDAKGLNDAEMQSLAREKNLSETAYVLPPSVKGADLQIRWFTPKAEVDLCGHATIASFHALAEEGMEGMSTQGQHYFKVQTKSGILSVRVEKNFQGTTVEFELPLPKFRIRKAVPASVLTALGIHARDLEKGMPIVEDADLFMPVKSLKMLNGLHPAYKELAALCGKGSIRGICVFTRQTVDKNSGVHSRFFAPAVGVDEDPVTGSANGPLGVYLSRFVASKGIPVASRELSDGRTEFIGEQGFAVGRPGHVKIRVTGEGDNVRAISIAGEAVTIMNSIATF